MTSTPDHSDAQQGDEVYQATAAEVAAQQGDQPAGTLPDPEQWERDVEAAMSRLVGERAAAQGPEQQAPPAAGDGPAAPTVEALKAATDAVNHRFADLQRRGIQIEPVTILNIRLMALCDVLFGDANTSEDRRKFEMVLVEAYNAQLDQIEAQVARARLLAPSPAAAAQMRNPHPNGPHNGSRRRR